MVDRFKKWFTVDDGLLDRILLEVWLSLSLLRSHRRIYTLKKARQSIGSDTSFGPFPGGLLVRYPSMISELDHETTLVV